MMVNTKSSEDKLSQYNLGFFRQAYKIISDDAFSFNNRSILSTNFLFKFYLSFFFRYTYLLTDFIGIGLLISSSHTFLLGHLVYTS